MVFFLKIEVSTMTLLSVLSVLGVLNIPKDASSACWTLFSNLVWGPLLTAIRLNCAARLEGLVDF